MPSSVWDTLTWTEELRRSSPLAVDGLPVDVLLLVLLLLLAGHLLGRPGPCSHVAVGVPRTPVLMAAEQSQSYIAPGRFVSL